MGCSNTTPSTDPNCADPAYRAAHPDECKGFTQLVLKPEYARVEPGKTVGYTVSLRANGTEIELASGLSWVSSNLGVATIAPDGIATGVTAGISTISVTWQDLSAQAQIEVVGSCAETHQNFMVLIDNSKSMGQSFSSSYATKLAFSKSVARDFAQTVNYSKDQIAASKFADNYSEIQAWTTDADAVRTAINAIPLAQEKTDLASALRAAIADFAGQVGTQVIVLFTDGEWSGQDPKPVAQEFRESGGVLVVVATQAWGDFYVDLMEMASGGFLLSAYQATQDEILGSLSGLKSFLCSGSCSPAPGTAPMAQLNYTGFINWDVTAGRVDLVGLGIWDIRPGNGLYVDLQGTGDEGVPPPGQDFGLGELTSKADFTFNAGENYRFSIFVGGGTAGNAPGLWEVRIRVGNELDQTIQILNGKLPFAPYVYEWTPTVTHTGKIIIAQQSIATTAHHNVGCTIDEVKLENLTTSETQLYDNFDSENPVTVPPSPANYGCLSSPPGSQSASPTPPTPRVTE